jgi:S-formylglutathione hydrolase FrmB
MSMLLRVICVAALTIALCVVTDRPVAKAAAVENLMVWSEAMGRDIPVSFMAGGPHAVYLLDAFDAGEGVSNWMTAGNAINTLAGKGVSVVAPAGGAYSMYTNWEKDPSKQWDTFLSDELPNWLSANKGLAPNGHAAAGASQGGYGAMAMACFHSDRFIYAGSFSGFIAPERISGDGALRRGMQAFGDTPDPFAAMWGPPQEGRWHPHSPMSQVNNLIRYNSRLWIFFPQSRATPDPASMIGIPEVAQSNNIMFYTNYRENQGHNAHFELGGPGDHGWGTWGSQLAAMTPDMVSSIR